MAQQESIFEQTIREFIKAVGGVENVKNAFNCASRFRFTVNDKSKVDIQLLKNIHLSKGLNISGEQYQLIFGPGTVNKVMDYYNKYLLSSGGLAQKTSDNVQQKQLAFGQKPKALSWNKDVSFWGNIFNLVRKGIRGFANIFIPLIPIFIGGGFCLALKALIGSCINNATTGFGADLAYFFNMAGGMIFSSLPIFAGYTCSKQWGGNPWFGAAIGAVLISPDIINSWSLQANGLVYLPIGSDASRVDYVIAFLKQLSGSDDWRNAQSAFVQQFNQEHWERLESALANNEISDALWQDFNNWKISSGESLGSLLSGVKIVRVLFSSCSFFSLKLIGYQGQVFTIILVNAFAVNVEKLLKKVIPDCVSLVFNPLLIISSSIWMAFWVIGPFGRWISDGVAFIFSSLFKYTNYGYGIGIGGAILAFLYSPLVMTGLHQGMLPVKATIISMQGVDYTTPIEICSNCSQGIAALVLLLFVVKSKEKLRGQMISGGISANFGITEPAIFGITLQCKHAFLAGMIGAAFGGWWVGMTQTLANTIGISSWLGLVQFSPFEPTESIQIWWNSLSWTPVLQNIPPMFNMLIALLIAVFATSLMTIILSATKFGKKQIAEYSQTNDQTQFALWLDKILKKNKGPKAPTSANNKSSSNKKEQNNVVQTSKNMFSLNMRIRGF